MLLKNWMKLEKIWNKENRLKAETPKANG